MKTQNCKTFVKQINENYTLITIERQEATEYYIEKNGYGHLFYVCGTEKTIELEQDYINSYIQLAEMMNFWGIGEEL